jgi:competence protein ComGC
MDGVFGGFTRWAIVFLIIFVLFILIIPHGY